MTMKKRLTSIIFILSIFVATACLAWAEDTVKTPTIEVVGKAKLMVMPNVATISFAVETNSSKAQDAVRGNAEQTQTLLNALKKISAKETKIKTSGFSLSPVYEERQRLRPSGYRVRNTVVVETKDLDEVGGLIDEASRGGAGSIGSLTFGTDEEERFRREAAAGALRDAAKSAEALAKAAGLTIKRIVRITYTPRPPVVVRSLAAHAERASTPVVIGEIPVEASVNVVFEVN
jgi:uncharacterized protein YggE